MLLLLTGPIVPVPEMVLTGPTPVMTGILESSKSGPSKDAGGFLYGTDSEGMKRCIGTGLLGGVVVVMSDACGAIVVVALGRLFAVELGGDGGFSGISAAVDALVLVTLVLVVVVVITLGCCGGCCC